MSDRQRLSADVALDITFGKYMPSEAPSYPRTVKHVDAHPVRVVGRDLQEVADLVDFIEDDAHLSR